MTVANRGTQKFLSTTSFGTERGALMNIKTVSAVSSALSGATETLTTLIPAGAMVFGVTVRVLTTITGATSFTIGDGTTANKWGATIGLTAGTVTTAANFVAGTSVTLYASATSVVLTATGSNFTAGVVMATVHYYDFTGATA